MKGTVEELPSGRFRARKKDPVTNRYVSMGVFDTEDEAKLMLTRPVPKRGGYSDSDFSAALQRNWRQFELHAVGLDGLLYVVHSGDHLKFGFTRDRLRLARRLRDLHSLCPTPVALVALTVCRIGIERWIHNELGEFRAQGEWYRLAGPVLEMFGAVALAEPWSPTVADEAA